jgi:hypothetical protein
VQLVLASGGTLRIETGALDTPLVCARCGAAMSVVASGVSMGTRVWLAAGATDIGEQSVVRSCLRLSGPTRRST